MLLFQMGAPYMDSSLIYFEKKMARTIEQSCSISEALSAQPKKRLIR